MIFYNSVAHIPMKKKEARLYKEHYRVEAIRKRPYPSDETPYGGEQAEQAAAK